MVIVIREKAKKRMERMGKIVVYSDTNIRIISNKTYIYKS